MMLRPLVLLVCALSVLVSGVWLAQWMVFIRSPAPGVAAPVRPAAMTARPDALRETLEAAPAVVWGGNGRTTDSLDVWVVVAPECGMCRAFLRDAATRPLGADIRLQVTVVPSAADLAAISSAERASLATWARRPSAEILGAWMVAGPPQGYYNRVSHPPAANDPERAAALAQSARTRRQLTATLRANGFGFATPAFFWRGEDGQWRAFMGDPQRARRAIEQVIAARSSQ